MKIIEVKFTPWDQVYYFSHPAKVDQSKVKIGDYLVVKTVLGIEVGKVVNLKDISESEVTGLGDIKPYLRHANNEDLKQVEDNNIGRDEQLKYCQEMVRRNQLDMKLVDCHVSYDGSRMTFAFIADGRIDFRNLVKDLTKRYKKSIRLQQLGVRDEAKVAGDIGSCGRCLCCKSHLKELGNVSTEFAKDQQIAHRGSERLSGVCGRLKCCLAYEEEFYKERLAKFPELGSKVKTKEGNGEVIALNLIAGTYDVLVRDDKKGNIVVKVEAK